MYNSKYECIYLKDDLFLKTDKLSNDEKEYLREIFYRRDLLNIFNLNEEDDNLLNKLDNILEDLYKLIYLNNELNELCKKSASIFFSTNEIDGLKILYSYDYMYFTHLCIAEFLETGIINENNLNKIKSII